MATDRRERTAMPIEVTFIIAAFNSERTIVRAIESALAQDGVSVEVIVVDDCSGDGTARAALDLASERVRVIRLGDNRGPGGARNAGLDAARGRWIAVLDADDAVYPDRMARLLGRAEEAGAQIVVDNLDVVDERAGSNRPMFSSARLAAMPELTLEAFVAGNHLFEETFSLGYLKPVIERDFLERHALRYVDTLRIGEDYVFLASALAKGGRCAVEPQPGYAYQTGGGSISSVLDLRHVEAMLQADELFLRDHALGPAARAAQRKRTRSLRKAASYLEIVGHLKDRAPIRAAATAIGNPAAVGLLRMPISVRWRRLTRPFRADEPAYE
jgi:succinoglycan biosynthesis protein ExoO